MSNQGTLKLPSVTFCDGLSRNPPWYIKPFITVMRLQVDHYLLMYILYVCRLVWFM